MACNGTLRKCWAYTPSERPSDWKLPMCGDDGRLDAGCIGGAAAALSPGGFRGNRVSIPSSALSGVKAKLRSAWRSVHPNVDASEMPDGIKT